MAISLTTEAEFLGLLPSAKVSSRVHKLCDIHIMLVIVNLDFANWYSHLVYSLPHTSSLHPQTQVVLGFHQLCIYTVPYEWKITEGTLPSTLSESINTALLLLCGRVTGAEEGLVPKIASTWSKNGQFSQLFPDTLLWSFMCQ